jgi:hypothetical protein
MPETLDPAESDVPSPLSRRGLIKQATVAGAATVAAGMALNTGLAGTAAAEDRASGPAGHKAHAAPVSHSAHSRPEASSEPFIVRVVDARTGELDIFQGHRHHRVRDQKLVAELLRAAR